MVYRNHHQLVFGHRPRRRVRRVLLVVGGLLIILMTAVWAYGHYSQPGEPTTDQFVIEPGEGVASITARLQAVGVVRSGWLFRQALKETGLAGQLQPGTYDLTGLTTYEAVAERLTTGGLPKNEFQVRLLEGWNLDQVTAALAAAGFQPTDEFTALVGQRRQGYSRSQPEPDWLDQYAFLRAKPAGQSLEGYLFPDTYRLFRDASAETVVKRLLDNFDRRLEQAGLHQQIAASGRDYHEIVTLASIVEREVRDLEDRRLVADLFWRRLEIGMGLQADSTVNYITDKGLAAVGADDLALDSPYNTYKYRGLPPGPISNPSLTSLQAVVDPLPNEYWYFLTDPAGTVYYARDFEEHKRNKARYLR
jgi:UPF0755 protein